MGKILGPTFGDELIAAGVRDGVTWDENGDLTFAPDLSAADIAKAQQVYAAHDPRGSLLYRRLKQIGIINTARDGLIFGGFQFNGYIYQSDINSQARIANSAASVTGSAGLPANFTWRTMGNVDVPMSETDMVALSAALQNHVASVLAISRKLKDQIAVSDNPESIAWPSNMSTPADEPLLGSVQTNVPKAAKLAVTALQPGDVPAQPQLAAVAMSGKYSDLSGTPVIPTLPTLAAVATSGKYADLTGKPTIPGQAVPMSITVTAAGLGTANLTGYTKPPAIVPIATWNGDTEYLPEIVSVSATQITVRAKVSRGTLLLSAGPFQTTTAAISVSFLVVPQP